MMNLARAAVLDVIKMQQGPVTQYTYTLSTSATQADLPMALRVVVPINPQTIDTLCAEVQRASESDTDHSERLRKAGKTLYQLLFPANKPEAQLLSSRLADWQDPLIISTNDAELPWEIMHDGREFLGTRLALGRQMITSNIFHQGRPIGEVRRALIVSNPTEDLPSADAETARLVAFLRKRQIECVLLSGAAATFVAVTGELNEGTHDIFHYSGHIGIDDGGRPGLRLFDQYLSADEIRSMLASNPEGSAGPPPVVFVNGCRSAEQLSSVCGAFLNTGSRIVIGTRYRVIDEAARAFAETWYGGLLSGMTAGSALRASRMELHDGPTGTWAAFVLFGQPATQLWSEPPPGGNSQPDTETPRETVPEPVAAEALSGDFWAERAGRLTPAATRLVARISALARDFGIITSFHLAAGLLEEETLLSTAVDLSGVERSMVADALEIFTGLGEPDGSYAVEDDVAVSANVRKTFEHAIGEAQARGAAAGVDEVAAAFMATGGGQAGELLRQLGVDLATSDSLFGRGGVLHAAFVAPETQRIIQCARFLSSTRGEVIGSYSLLLGAILAGSPVLREALLDQGPHGEKVVRSLFPEAQRLTSRDFSPRAHTALDDALAANDGLITDAGLLVSALSDPKGSASTLIQSWGLDLDRLRASCLAVLTQQASAVSDVDSPK